jgi:hypothetical protein
VVGIKSNLLVSSLRELLQGVQSANPALQKALSDSVLHLLLQIKSAYESDSISKPSTTVNVKNDVDDTLTALRKLQSSITSQLTDKERVEVEAQNLIESLKSRVKEHLSSPKASSSFF